MGSVIDNSKKIYHQFNAKITTYSREEYIELINFLGSCEFDILLNPKDFDNETRVPSDDSPVME
jgi:hypothetical protein